MQITKIYIKKTTWYFCSKADTERKNIIKCRNQSDVLWGVQNHKMEM